MPETEAKTVALLLAAGESRRMGELKALLPWQGQTLLAHQLAALSAAGVDRTVVVVGHRFEELQPELEGKPGVDWVVNPDYLQGKTTSIKAGLRALDSDPPESLLILNVDQPRSAETLDYLLRQHRAAASLVTIPTYGDKGGHPIILDAALLDELHRIEEETQGIRAVVQRHRQFTQRVAVDSPEVLWDLNTPEQYREALEG
jgi:molybdenum cofactor cytidylyltransferase